MSLHAAASLLPPNPLQLAAALSLAGKWGAMAQLEELGSGGQDSVLTTMTQAAQVCVDQQVRFPLNGAINHTLGWKVKGRCLTDQGHLRCSMQLLAHYSESAPLPWLYPMAKRHMSGIWHKRHM